MEIARSIVTKEILNAKVAWEISCQDNTLEGRSMFICLDDEHCGIQLTLTNYGDENGLRKYFKRHNIEHDKDCIMKSGTLEEMQNLQIRLNPNISPKELQKIIETGNKNISIREPKVKKTSSSQNYKLVEKSKNDQEKSFRNYDKTKNKALSDSVVSSIASLYSFFIDNSETVIKDIKWSFFDRNNQKMKNYSFMKQNFPIKDIFLKIEEDSYLEWYVGKIYFGKVWINRVKKTNGNNIVIKFIDKPDIAICWTNEDELSGMANINQLRNALEKKFPIDICIVGYFYKDKNTNTIKGTSKNV